MRMACPSSQDSVILPKQDWRKFNKLCVFCAIPLNDGNKRDADKESSYYGSEKNTVMSQKTFVQGISILCDQLNFNNKNVVERDKRRRFSKVEEWAPVGIDNFVSLVCCEVCYKLLATVVSLHQLIVQTQATLKKSVEQLEAYIVESENKAEKDDLEYSINTCDRFRKEILRNIHRAKDDTRKFRKSPRHHNRHHHSQTEFATKLADASSTTFNPPTAYVRLERLPEATIVGRKAARDIVNSEEDCNNSNFSDNDFDCSNHELESSLETDPASFYDDSRKGLICQPVYEQEDPGKGRSERERSSKKSKLAGKRMVTRKGNLGEERIQKNKKARMTGMKSNDFVKKETPVKNDYEECGPLKRSRRRKACVLTSLSTADSDDDQRLPNKNDKDSGDENYSPEECSSSDNDSESENDLEEDGSTPEKPSRKVRKRCLPRVGTRTYRLLHEESPIKYKPIYVIDDSQGLLMFLNVKFQRTHYTLQCLHPNCQHSEPILGYFADQLTFHGFRYHVRRTHRKVHRFGGSASESLYYCHTCEAQLDNRDNLMEHRRTLHPNFEMPPALCEVCGDTMPQSQILEHVISHKNEEEKEVAEVQLARRVGRTKDLTQPLIFHCNECDKAFKTLRELRIHQPTHIPLEIRRQFICDMCGEKFAKLQLMEHHKRQVHLGDLPKSLVCEICNRKYYKHEISKFKDHVRSHTGEKPYQCPTCGKAFHVKWSLTKHERTHTDRSVTCEFCSQIYKSCSLLRRHHLKHHPELVDKPDPKKTAKYIHHRFRDDFIGPKRMYPCEPCNHLYTSKGQLIHHLKTGKHDMKLANKQDYPSMWTMEDQASNSEFDKTSAKPPGSKSKRRRRTKPKIRQDVNLEPEEEEQKVETKEIFSMII